MPGTWKQKNWWVLIVKITDMQKISFLLILFLFSSGVSAQNDTLKTTIDSLLVINTFDYDLNYGISMFHRFCPDQKTYNKQNMLLRELTYIKNDGEQEVTISSVIYYFYYTDNSLKSEEYYKADGTFNFLVKYIYNTDHQLVSKTKFSLTNNKLVFLGDTLYKYKEIHLVQVVARDKKKKKSSKTLVTYEPGKEIHTCTFISTKLTENQPKQLITEKLIIDGQIVEENRITVFNNLQTDTLQIKSNYNTGGQLTEQSFYKSKSLQYIVKYDYYPEGIIKSISKTDKEGKKITFQGFEVKRFLHDFGGLESKLE
jgi:hypothetical protein